MKFLDFLKNIPHRLCWNINMLTAVEIFGVLAIPFVMKYANPAYFVEGALVENLQLLILTAALIVALKAKRDKTLFVALALTIILMLMRETNIGRAYFCAKYLPPEEICRWKNMKYGFIVEPLRDLYGVSIIFYIWLKKVYKTVWQYILQAPAFVWDSLILVVAVIMAIVAEWQMIDNEILEESSETLMYIAFTNLIWRYAKNDKTL